MVLFLRLLCIVWGTALGLAVAQVGICETRAGSRPQQCQQEWQLATATVLGLGSQLFSLFQKPPSEL
jgi:hypothetical protein